jgi:hypothetical protein
MSARVSLATVDTIHAGPIREALTDAGIEAQLVEVQTFNQLAYLRHQRRPMVDVQVAGEDEAAARAVLQRVEEAAAEALYAQAGGDPDAVKSEDDLRLEAEAAAQRALSAERPRSPWVGALLALFLPVVGPAYAAAGPLVLGSLLVNLIALTVAIQFGFPDKVHPAIAALLVAVRVAEALITRQEIRAHNGRIARSE